MICSSARPVKNGDAAHTNAVNPAFARPAATPTMFCSAMPTSIKRSGKRSRNSPKLLEPTESLQTTTILGFSVANAIKVLAKIIRLSNSSSFSLIAYQPARALVHIVQPMELYGAIQLYLP